jgi:GntR family transcriptional repressor for pyruvate dehydrogenase complex
LSSRTRDPRDGGPAAQATGDTVSFAGVAKISRSTLPEEITRRIVDAIRSGEFKPGNRLPPERELAQALGVSRTSVREALKYLTLMGLLEVRLGDGTYLREDSHDAIANALDLGLLLRQGSAQHLIEARTFIEAKLAELAAERGSLADLNEIDAAFERMVANVSDLERFLEADVRFHLIVGHAAGNPVLERVLQTIRGFLRVWIEKTLDGRREAERVLAEHRAIRDAITARDPDAARAAMEAHLGSRASRLLQVLPR